jgi:hypothetical protein
MPAIPCGQTICRAFKLTVREFEALGGEAYTQSFRVRLIRRATNLHRQIYRKAPEKVCDKIWVGTRERPWRNYLNTYPCGIREQAYRELKPVAAE